jgi:3-oxoadipate enol-lactonase
MAFHQINRIAVEESAESGNGDAVVCVHGLGGSSNTFEPLMPALSRRRVIRVDLPGSGRSQGFEGALSIDLFVSQLIEICTRLKVTHAHWLGHSMGTIVCQHIAVQQPKLVVSLALFGPLMEPPDAARTALRARAAKARDSNAQGMQDITEALVQTALSNDTRQRQPIAVAYVRESLMRQHGEAYARTCLALADAKAADVSRITAPLLLVTGDEDGVAPPQAVRSMAEKFHQAKSKRVVVLPRCGHWTPIERAEDCQRELHEFLASQNRN